jgi:hypothetical protein
MPSTLGAATAARPVRDAPARGAAGAPAGKIAMLPIAGVDDTTRLFRLSARCFVAVRARADHTLTIAARRA